jgi:hypothetical protein
MRLTKPPTQAVNNPRNTYIPQLCPGAYDVTIYFASTANEVSDAFGPYGVNSVSFPIRHQLEAEATL